MRNLRKPISNVLFAMGMVFVAGSLYCFWDAYQIRQQQLQKAGDDPFVMVFSDKIQPEDTSKSNDEMTMLNNQRLRAENTGRLLIISGVVLVVATTVIKNWKRKPEALSIIEEG